MMRSLTILMLAAALGALSACATDQAAAPATSPAGPDTAERAPVISPDPDASAYGLFLAGETARDEGHLAAAAAYLARAAAAEGGPTYLRADAFTAALQAGDVAGAAQLAAATPSGADTQLGLLVRGVEALTEGKDKDAYGFFASPDMTYPQKTAALLLAPFAAAGAHDDAQALARPALDADAVAQFVADLDRAGLQERLGRQAAAEAGFKALMQGGDESGIITRAYGGFLERRGRWADAAALYKDRLAHSPDDDAAAGGLARAAKRGRAPTLGSIRQAAAESLLIPAAALMAQKQEVVSLEYLRLALRLDPANDEAWLLVGELLAPADLGGAREAYASVEPGSESYVIARGKLAWSYQTAGDHDAALKLARATAAANPDSRQARSDLADLLRANDDYAESAAVLTQLIDAPGAKPDWRLYYLRASAFEEIGDPDKTQADLTAALKLDPGEPELLNFQGYFWIERGENLKEALGLIQRAVEAEPQSGEIIDSLGWAYYRLGDYKSAVEKLEAAVTLDPSIPEVNDHLGDAYWRVGRKTEASFQWRRVLSLDPDAKLKASVERKLASPQGPDAPAVAPPALSTP
jgi:tetratricopeptide (TPR) repeat protein